MPFKEKAIVRHKLRPDWGAGRVLMRSDEYLQIDFSAGGLKKLKTSIADDHLEQATPEEVKALKPEKVKATTKRAVVAKAAIPPATAIAGKAPVAAKAAAIGKTAVTGKAAPAGKIAGKIAGKTAGKTAATGKSRTA